MIKTTAIIVVALLAAFLMFAATRPDTFRITRTIGIKAPPEKIYPLINDLRNHASWGPWEELDPAMKRTFSGSSAGTGAIYAWEGNHSVGKGRIEIADTVAPSRVRMKLDYVEPFEAHNTVEFTLQPGLDATIVTWDLNGSNNFIGKIVSMVFSERVVGAMFEKGLAKLKAIAEQSAART